MYTSIFTIYIFYPYIHISNLSLIISNRSLPIPYISHPSLIILKPAAACLGAFHH